MEPMTGYKITSAMHGEISIEGHGTVAYEFDAGTVTPKDDTEAAVLEVLAANGVVEIADKPAKPKPAKPEPVTDKE